ncbi:hypothetical protein BD410DRAFT_779340 [Rickenella mellea]|uniref:Uncharacterized protein n=1 Tax=Rickenella mellea TaxID=50990 RepID=A0A4R5XFY6_9AGAM|nr:hypothetical protein BD410DRAFT_779340 [Rickenella mellea]
MSTSDTSNLQVVSGGPSSQLGLPPGNPDANATASKRVQKAPKLKRPKPKVYGYALKDAWITSYAARHNLCPPGSGYDPAERVLLKIMGDTRIGDFCTVKCRNGARDTGLCLRLCDNWSRCGMCCATREKIETVKRVLETGEEPKWYYAD